MNNIKGQWLERFQELLWQHHTYDWNVGNRNPDYPYQLATAYFDWGLDGQPEKTVSEAFSKYLEALEQ